MQNLRELLQVSCRWNLAEVQLEKLGGGDRYKIDYSGVAVKPEVARNSLKRLVGEREDLNLRPAVPSQILQVMEIY